MYERNNPGSSSASLAIFFFRAAAVGACAMSGCVYRGSYNVIGGIDQLIPVNIYVPGCPPRPEAIIDGVVKLLGALESGKATPIERPRELDPENLNHLEGIIDPARLVRRTNEVTQEQSAEKKPNG